MSAGVGNIAALISLFATWKGIQNLASCLVGTTFKPAVPDERHILPTISLVRTAATLQAIRNQTIHEAEIVAHGIEAGVRMRTRRALNEIYYAASDARHHAPPHRVDLTA